MNDPGGKLITAITTVATLIYLSIQIQKRFSMKYLSILFLLVFSLGALAAEQSEKIEAIINKALVEWNPENKYWYEAADLLKEPLERGDAWAKYYVAFLFNYGAGGYPQDHKRAWDLTLEAANAGYADAMFNVAIQLEDGALNLEKDQAKAIEWYKKGALAGSSLAAGRISDAYRNGELGLKVNPEEAGKWEEVKRQCED